MSQRALFEGLVVDESGQAVETAFVGGEAFYVIDDDGFRRHVEAEQIDRVVLRQMREQVLSNRDMVTEASMQMIGKDDLFTKAMIDSSLDNIDDHLNQLIRQGLPMQARQWLGMLGFNIVVDYRGEVVAVNQPEAPLDDE